MAKDLPYFKFFCSEWNDGDITLENYKTQGVFINVCSYYWSNECDITIKKLKKRFKNNEKEIEILFSEELIKKDGVNVIITFLDEQQTERESKSKINSKNGSLGGRPKKPIKSENKPNALSSLSETKGIKRREEKKREEEIIDKKKRVYFLSWLEYRKEIKKAIKSESTLNGLVKKFNVNSIDEIKRCVESSINNGWAGLFWNEVKDTKKQNKILDSKPILYFCTHKFKKQRFIQDEKGLNELKELVKHQQVMDLKYEKVSDDIYDKVLAKFIES